MSLHGYLVSQAITIADLPFYSLIMAAMRQADSLNLEGLQRIFPDVWQELEARYHAPGGVLEEDKVEDLSRLPKFRVQLTTRDEE